jgi:hypothetical protein
MTLNLINFPHFVFLTSKLTIPGRLRDFVNLNEFYIKLSKTYFNLF